MTGGWLSLDEVFKRHDSEAAHWMNERDRRLAEKKRDEPDDDRRRRSEDEAESEDDR